MEIKAPPSRHRAVRLRAESLERLHVALNEKWRASYSSRRLTRELKAEIIGVSVVTSERLLRGGRVDRATLAIAFQSLSLELQESDIVDERPPKGSDIHGSDLSGASGNGIPFMRTALRASDSKRRSFTYISVIVVLLAISTYWLMIARRNSSDERRELVLSAYAKGLDHYHHGRLEEAQMEVDRILSLARSFDSAYGLADSLRLAGDLAAARGQLEDAEAKFKEAFAIHVNFGNDAKQAELWEAIGNVQLRQGKLDVAKESFENSLDGQIKAGSMIGKAMAYRGLGSVQYQLGDHEGATGLFLKAIRCLDGYKEPAMVVDLRGRMALVEHRKGNSNAALKQLFECLEYWKASNSLRTIALVELDIGTVAHESGNKELATRHLTHARDQFAAIGDEFNLAIAKGQLELAESR